MKVYIDMDFDGLRSDIVQMLGGGCVRGNTRSFQNDMSVSGWPKIMQILKTSEKLLNDTLNGNADSVVEALDQ